MRSNSGPGILLAFFLAVAAAGAHVVEQFYAERDGEGIELLFDVGYAKPEWRDDADRPAPTRDWLEGRSAEAHARLRGEAERYLREHLRFESGGEPVRCEYRFPDFDTQPPAFPNLLTGGAYYRVRIVPPDVRPLTLEVNGDFPDLVLATKDEGDASPSYLTLESGESISLSEPAPKAPPPLVHAFLEGVLHVLPKGLDHILFILGIFLLRRSWKPLLWQSLAFTAAHTLTLGLTAAGVFTPSPKWVEALIALSIATLAVENLFIREFRPYRLGLVFGFGLIHGMGFARALAPLLGTGEGFLPRLMCTNLGVEVAQVSILAAAGAATWWHKSVGYPRFRLAANGLLAVVALYWFVQRVS